MPARRLRPVDPVELGRVADGLVHLELHLLCVDDDRGRGGPADRRGGGPRPARPRAAPRARARATRRTPSRPGRSSRRGRSGSFGSGRARPPGRRHRGPRTPRTLEDVGAVRGAEGPLLPHRARRCLDDRHVGPPRRPPRERGCRSSPRAEPRSDRARREFATRRSAAGRSASSTRLRGPAGARAGELDGAPSRLRPSSERRGFPAKSQAPPTRTRTPGPPLSPCRGLDLAVLRRHVLLAAEDRAGVRVPRAGREGRVDCRSAQFAHGAER